MWFVDQLYHVNYRVHYVRILNAIYDLYLVSLFDDELIQVFVYLQCQIYDLRIPVYMICLKNKLRLASPLNLLVKYVAKQMNLTVLKVKVLMGVPCDTLIAEKVIIERYRHSGVGSFTTLKNPHFFGLTACKFVFIISGFS